MQKHVLPGLANARALLEGSYNFSREIRSLSGGDVSATCEGTVRLEHFQSGNTDEGASGSDVPVGSAMGRVEHEVCWLRYQEQGQLVMSGKESTPFAMRQSYLYRLSSGSLDANLDTAVENVLLHIIRTDVQGANVSFDQGSLLCEFDLTSISEGEVVSAKTHLCGQDNYTGKIVVSDGRFKTLVFDVVGPEKSNRITTDFTKVT